MIKYQNFTIFHRKSINSNCGRYSFFKDSPKNLLQILESQIFYFTYFNLILLTYNFLFFGIIFMY